MSQDFILPLGKPQLLAYIAKLPESRKWLVTISAYRKKRTLEQNSLFHALAGELADQTGESPARMKEILKAECGLWAVSKITGKEYPKSTTEYSTAEMTDFCDRIWSFAAEHGFTLRLPGEER